MYVLSIPILIVLAVAILGVAPAVAGSNGLDFSDQSGASNASGLVKHDKKPGETKDDARIQNYLFLGQDNLEFNEGPALDSGLLPASGDDEEIRLQPGQKPTLPKYE